MFVSGTTHLVPGAKSLDKILRMQALRSVGTSRHFVQRNEATERAKTYVPVRPVADGRRRSPKSPLSSHSGLTQASGTPDQCSAMARNRVQSLSRQVTGCSHPPRTRTPAMFSGCNDASEVENVCDDVKCASGGAAGPGRLMFALHHITTNHPRLIDNQSPFR